MENLKDPRRDRLVREGKIPVMTTSSGKYEVVQNQEESFIPENFGAANNRYFKSVFHKRRILRNVVVVVIPGMVVLLIGIGIGWGLMPMVIKYYVGTRLAVSPDVNPEFYAAWEKFPLPIYMKVYLFHVSNPEQVRAGELPKLKEMGPYTFLEKKVKDNIVHDEATDTISYKLHSSYYFEPTLSGNATLTDKITILNVPFLTAAIKIAEEVPWPFKGIGNTILASYKAPLFLEKTVEEVLFEGWKVPFLEKMEEDIGITFIPNNTFGFYAGQNGSIEGPFTISRGIQDKSRLGVIFKYRNESTLDFWGDDRNSYCNKITGTDGTIFPPHLTKETVLGFFGHELCHSLYAIYKEDVVFRDITGYRFTLSPSIFGDCRKYPENTCYCSSAPQNTEHCLKKGAMEVGPCKDGAPVAISHPYFLDGDEEYQRKSGLTPNRTKHETYIVLEPHTGIIMQGSRKLQVNLMMQPVKSHSSLRKLPEMLFPLLWAEESTQLDDKYGDIIKANLNQIWWADVLTKGGSIATALVIFLVILSNKDKVTTRFSVNTSGISQR